LAFLIPGYLFYPMICRDVISKTVGINNTTFKVEVIVASEKSVGIKIDGEIYQNITSIYTHLLNNSQA
jgi:hypothetical protein